MCENCPDPKDKNIDHSDEDYWSSDELKQMASDKLLKDLAKAIKKQNKLMGKILKCLP